jgi:hypothetical protein
MLGSLRDWGRVVLTTSGYLNKTDRAVVEQAVRQLRAGEPEMFALLRKMSDAASARKLLEHMAAIAGAAYVIGAHGAMTDTQDRFLKVSHAAHMRFRRGESKRELAVRAAIKAEIEAAKGGLPSGHPYKDADSILKGVNERLSELGYKNGISLKALYRRLRNELYDHT